MAVGFAAEKAVWQRHQSLAPVAVCAFGVDTDTRSAFLELNDPFLLGIQYNGETLGTTISRLKARFRKKRLGQKNSLRYDFGLNYTGWRALVADRGSRVYKSFST